MKSLKTILIVFLLLQTAVSFGQTKDETIAWIKDKLINNTLLVSPDYAVKGGNNK